MTRTRMLDRGTRRTAAPVVTIKMPEPHHLEEARALLKPGQRLVIVSSTTMLLVNIGSALDRRTPGARV